MKAVSLLYHDVIEDGRFHVSGRRGATADRFKMPVETFEAHLTAIRERKRAVCGTVLDSVDNSATRGGTVGATGRKTAAVPVLLTFDDGGSSALTHVADRLEELGWRGHFFVISNRIDKAGFLTGAEIRALRARGHVVGTHTYSHPRRISHLPWDQLVREWRMGAEDLSQVLGEPVRVGSVPGGFYSRQVARAARDAGLRFLFNSEPTTAVHQVDDCLVFGRFALFGETTARTAGGFAARDLRPRTLQWMHWNAKKILKIVGGKGYLWLRRRVIEHRQRSWSRARHPRGMIKPT